MAVIEKAKNSEANAVALRGSAAEGATSGVDSWTGEASGEDLRTGEASGAQCAAQILKMVTAIMGIAVDGGMPCWLESVKVVSPGPNSATAGAQVL